MKISKVLIILAVAVLTTFLFSTVALAGGWHKLGPKEGNLTDEWNPDAGLWSSQSGGITARIPHYGLSSSSNNCRTCHAVHNADNVGKGLGVDLNGDGDDTDANEVGIGQAFKMLRNESRATECNFCHGPVGALSNPIKKPYADMLTDDPDGAGPLTPTRIPPKGQHTLGAKAIPDSTITSGNSIFTDGLSCGNCHSVHGGYTLNDVPNSGMLGTRILRRDPANNGDRVIGGAAAGVVNVAAQGGSNIDNSTGINEPIKPGVTDAVNESQLLAAFCGDCHNKNVNWSTGGSGVEGDVVGVAGANEGTRPNRYGHPLGDIDGLIDIYGKLGRVESVGVNNAIKTGPLASEATDMRMSCDDCHKSRQVTPSKFPHQSTGHKLLSNAYTDTSTPLDGPSYRDTWDTSSGQTANDSYTGNPDRPIPNLDAKVCRTCHGTDGTYPGIGVPGDSGSF